MDEQPLHLNIHLWLEKLDLSAYKSLFKSYKGVEDILWMSERDLKELGVKNGSHRARLSTSLSFLKEKYDRVSKESRNFLSSARSAYQEKAKSNNSMSPIKHMYFEDCQTGVRSWPSTKPSTTFTTEHSSPQSNTENYVGTEAIADELKKALERELSLDHSDLRSYAWYHGTILRQRAEELVAQDGDFIVRDCISQPGDFVITSKWNNTPLHFIIKKVILQPNTVYERIQYCFEKESFDSVSDFITYYVGSKCPLSESTGVIINRPINRVMPLSYYSSRYGIQCQIHYVAKALEKVPSSPEHRERHSLPIISNSPILHTSPKLEVPLTLECASNNYKVKKPVNMLSNLIRVGSDPTLSPSTERRPLEHRPNSGIFNSDTLAPEFNTDENKPPPKPSRVPSKKCPQRPFVVKKERKMSEVDDGNENSPFIPIPGLSLAHASFMRQTSETRFSFLDRPSISSSCSTPDAVSTKSFSLPKIPESSVFEPQVLQTPLLSRENPPLEGQVLSKLRQILLCSPPKHTAYHLTKMDLDIAKHYEEIDLGLGVNSGLELLLLPQGVMMQQDLLERTECMKLFVAVLILTCPDDEERAKVINRWIEVAIETKTALGNFYGFTSIMLGLTLPEILGLHSTWLILRCSYTESAFAFETKLRPTLTTLHNASNLEAPNTCLPYVLSLILILQQHVSAVNAMEQNSDTGLLGSDIASLDLPGNNAVDDFGLQLLSDHLETGRHIMQQIPVLRKNGEMSFQNIKLNQIMLDIFSTEFHLRLLWGFRGSIVLPQQRHPIFQKVIHSLYSKCNLANKSEK